MVMRQAIDFLLSLKTSVWLLCLLALVFLAGAFVMPAEEAFQSVHSMPLLEWMTEQPLRITWWLWASVGLLFLLAANTLFCSIHSILNKRRVAEWMLLISPQIIHIGFLFMLFAHLLSALGGFKVYGVAGEGSLIEMPDGGLLKIGRINISVDSLGYLTDWKVDVESVTADGTAQGGTLGPNKPLFRGETGIYVRDLRAFPVKAILVEMSREPGAVCALIGGLLFMAGTVTLLLLKMRRDGRQ